MDRWDGPTLKAAIQQRHYADKPYVHYRYVDGDGRRAPQYAARHIRIEAFYVATRSTPTPLRPAQPPNALRGTGR